MARAISRDLDWEAKVREDSWDLKWIISAIKKSPRGYKIVTTRQKLKIKIKAY